MKRELPETIKVGFTLKKVGEEVDGNELYLEYEVEEVTAAGFEPASVRAVARIDLVDSMDLTEAEKNELLAGIISDNFKEDVVKTLAENLNLVALDPELFN